MKGGEEAERSLARLGRIQIEPIRSELPFHMYFYNQIDLAGGGKASSTTQWHMALGLWQAWFFFFLSKSRHQWPVRSGNRSGRDFRLLQVLEALHLGRSVLISTHLPLWKRNPLIQIILVNVRNAVS